MFGISSVAGDFHTPVDRARVHNDDSFADAVKQSPVDPEVLGILPKGREVFDILAFQLDAKHISHIASFERFPDIVFDAHAEPGQVFGYQRRRSANFYLGAHFLQTENIAQCYP